MSGEACCQDSRAALPVIGFSSQRQHGASGSFDAHRNLGFCLRRFGNCYRYECLGPQEAQMSESELKIADIDAKIRSLNSMKRTLRKLTNACEGCGPIAECPILESLDLDKEKNP